MSKVVKYAFGQMTGAFNDKKEQYNDWRQDILEVPGIILILSPEQGIANERYIRFYPITQFLEESVSGIRTSTGIVTEKEAEIKIKTQNSTYFFSIEPNCLTERDKIKMILQLDLEPNEEDKVLLNNGDKEAVGQITKFISPEELREINANGDQH